MALQNGFPGHTALASFADLRRDLEGAVVRSAAGVLRAGVFPDHLDPLVTGRTDMKVNIADFRAVQNRGGAIFLANVGVDSSVTLDAAPASNKRIDLVYVYQQSVTLGDAASTPVFGVVKGTASATPTVPPLPAGVSTAIPLATVEIPAGATTTLSAGVIFTQVYPYTAMAGGTVVVRNSVELAAWSPAAGAVACVLDDGNTYVRGTGWKATSGGLSVRRNALQALSSGWSNLTGLTTVSNTCAATVSDGAITFTRAGKVLVTAIYQHNAGATAVMSTSATLNSATVTGDEKTFVDAAAGANGASHTRVIEVAAGDVLRLFMAGTGISATEKCGVDLAYIR